MATQLGMFQVVMILSMAVWIFGSVKEGAFSVQTGGLILVALVALAAFGKSQGWGLIGTVFRVVVPIGSLLTFAIWNGRGDSEAITGILFGLMTVVVALYGVYIIVSSVFRKQRKRRKYRKDR